jgi:four helix bundle protein
MAVAFEDLKVLQSAENMADDLWKQIVEWDIFKRDTVGKQLVRAVDSIGANIAEAYGRYHFGEKLQFFYYARGSLFETKYWINRANNRHLIDTDLAQKYAEALSSLAHQLNALAKKTKHQRKKDDQKIIREESASYRLDNGLYDFLINEEIELFSSDEIT